MLWKRKTLVTNFFQSGLLPVWIGAFIIALSFFGHNEIQNYGSDTWVHFFYSREWIYGEHLKYVNAILGPRVTTTLAPYGDSSLELLLGLMGRVSHTTVDVPFRMLVIPLAFFFVGTVCIYSEYAVSLITPEKSNNEKIAISGLSALVTISILFLLTPYYALYLLPYPGQFAVQISFPLTFVLYLIFRKERNLASGMLFVLSMTAAGIAHNQFLLYLALTFCGIVIYEFILALYNKKILILPKLFVPLFVFACIGICHLFIKYSYTPLFFDPEMTNPNFVLGNPGYSPWWKIYSSSLHAIHPWRWATFNNSWLFLSIIFFTAIWAEVKKNRHRDIFRLFFAGLVFSCLVVFLPWTCVQFSKLVSYVITNRIPGFSHIYLIHLLSIYCITIVISKVISNGRLFIKSVILIIIQISLLIGFTIYEFPVWRTSYTIKIQDYSNSDAFKYLNSYKERVVLAMHPDLSYFAGSLTKHYVVFGATHRNRYAVSPDLAQIMINDQKIILTAGNSSQTRINALIRQKVRLIMYDKQGIPDHRNLMTKDWEKDVGISFLKKTYEDKQYVIFETKLEKFMVD